MSTSIVTRMSPDRRRPAMFRGVFEGGFFAGALLLGCVSCALLAGAGCSRDARRSDDGDDGGDESAADLAVPNGGPSCTGLLCNIAECDTGTKTTLTGKVLAPNGKDPVPGARIYVPNQGLPEFPVGVGCDLCSDVENAAAQAKSAFDGTFTMTDVPSGDAVAVVVQLGRFRRVITMHIDSCVTQALPKDAATTGTRLPKHAAEFDPNDSVPAIAVATGDYDQIECVLKRMGLDKIDLYNDRPAGSLPPTIGSLLSLVTDANKLLTYNILVVNCTDNEYQSLVADAGVRANLEGFVKMGGRLYVTDWAYDAIEQIPEFAPYMCFEPQSTGGAPMCSTKPESPSDADTTDSYDNQALVKDPDLAQWLGQFPGVIDATQHVAVAYSFVVVDAVSTSMSYPTKVWLEGDTGGYGVKPMTITFDYNQCGRVHYSTYNTEPNGVVPDDTRYPDCVTTFSPQERVLEYLMFEIANCIAPIQ